MKTFKYPWKVIRNIDNSGTLCFYSIHNNKNEALAEIYVTDDTETEIQNAYLMSCAPELLETLELVQAWFMATNQANDMLDLIAYTILKAKGKIGVDNSLESLL